MEKTGFQAGNPILFITLKSNIIMKIHPLKILLRRLNNPFIFFIFIGLFSLGSFFYFEKSILFFSLSLTHLEGFKLWTLFTHPFLQTSLPALFLSLFALIFFTRKLSYQIPLSLLGSFFWKTTFFSACTHLLMNSEKALIFGIFPHCVAFGILFGHYHGSESLKDIKNQAITLNTCLFIFTALLFSLCTLNLLPGTSIPSLLGASLFSWFHIRKVHQFSTTNVETYSAPSFTYTHASPAHFAPPAHTFHEKHSASMIPPAQPPAQEEIDKVLDKILEKGIVSLTDKEKNILKNASHKTKV